MKKLLLAAVLLAGCEKEQNQLRPVPEQQQIIDLNGTYDYIAACNTSNYNSVAVIFDGNKMHVTGAQLSLDTIDIVIEDGTLTIPPYTVANTGWAGGTKTVQGSGTFSSDTMIYLNYTITYLSSQGNAYYSCTATMTRQ